MVTIREGSGYYMRRKESIIGGCLSTCEGLSGKKTVNIEKSSRARAELVRRGQQQIMPGFEPFCTAMGSR